MIDFFRLTCSEKTDYLRLFGLVFGAECVGIGFRQGNSDTVHAGHCCGLDVLGVIHRKIRRMEE